MRYGSDLLAKGVTSAALAVILSAASAPAESLAPIPRLTARVTDLTGTLNPGQAQAIEARLQQFEQAKGAQLALLIVPTTQPETIEQYSLRVVEAWKLGRAKTDDGALLIVAKNDRALRIEVGYGLEGALPDAIAKRIIEETIVPHFRAGDFALGVSEGLDQMMKVVEGEPLPPPASVSRINPEEALDNLPILLFGVIFLGAFLRAWLGRLPGASVAGVAAGGVSWYLSGLFLIAGALAFFVFIAVLFGDSRGGSGRSSFGGGSSRGFGGGGGFSGGGGGFGGGGASGRW